MSQQLLGRNQARKNEIATLAMTITGSAMSKKTSYWLTAQAITTKSGTVSNHHAEMLGLLSGAWRMGVSVACRGVACNG